jgi:putative SOS response-associated peptidase YedK
VPAFVKEPQTKNLLINARSETLKDKSAFKNAFRYRRCIIPASGFYEWSQDAAAKNPRYFSHPDKKHLCFAGIWEIWHGENGEELNSCAIITMPANRSVDFLHQRMPLVVSEELIGLWLSPDPPDDILLRVLKKGGAINFCSWRVSCMVNSIKNDQPGCIEPYRIMQPGLFDNFP